MLVDWGIASAMAFRDNRLTRSHEALGTIRFSAPEQLERGHLGASARADIYSVGRVLEYLATGDTAQADDVIQGMPPGLEAVVRRATHSDPDLRFRQAMEMVAALREREQVGWGEGGPVQAGDRLGESYDLVEAKGEPYPGCHVFRAVEVETGRHLRLLLARRGSDAAKLMIRTAGQVDRAPTTVRFGSLLCCAEDEDHRGGVGEQMVRQGREQKTASPQREETEGSLVSQLAISGAASSVQGLGQPGLTGYVAGLLGGGAVATALGVIAGYSAYRFLGREAPPAHLQHLTRLDRNEAMDPLAAMEALRRVMLVLLVQTRTHGSSKPAVSVWREDCPDSFASTGQLLFQEFGRLPRKERPTIKLGELVKQITASSELRNSLAHGVIGSRPEAWAEARVSRLSELVASLISIGTGLEEMAPVKGLSPLVKIKNKTVHVLAPMGQGLTYLALDVDNSLLEAPAHLG